MILLLLSTFACLTGLRYVEAFHMRHLLMTTTELKVESGIDAWDQFITSPEPEVEGLMLQALMPGYAVLNVTATKCNPSGSNEDVRLDIDACDGSNDIVLHHNICKAGGATVCLPSKIKSPCVRVKAGNVSSGNFTLPPFKPFYHNKEMKILAWKFHQDTNSSSIKMERIYGVYKYLMTLTPVHEQVNAAGHIEANKEKAAECGPAVSLTAVFPLHAVNETSATFTVNWSSLNTSCVYRCEVRPYNACEGPLTTPTVLEERLQYLDSSRQPVVDRVNLPTWVVVLVVVVCILVAVLAALHLYKTLKLTRRALLSVYPESEKKVKETQQMSGALKEAHQKQRSLNKGSQQCGVVRDTPLKESKKKVLVVYADDVKAQVVALMKLLQERTDCQILDLYDPLDVDKLRDGTGWLAARLLDPAAVFLLVASIQARKLQVLHASTMEGHKSHSLEDNTSPHLKKLTEKTHTWNPDFVFPTGCCTVGHAKSENTCVWNMNKKDAEGLDSCSTKAHTGLTPQRLSASCQSYPDEEDFKSRSLPASKHLMCSSGVSVYNNSNTSDQHHLSTMKLRDQHAKINTDDDKETTEEHESQANVSGTKTVKEKTELRSDKTATDEMMIDSVVNDSAEQEVFHFLFLDFLHKMESSFFSQDYNRLYQIKFKETPEHAVLDHVTPGRLYHLPDHLDHLLSTLTCPTHSSLSRRLI